MNKVEFYERVRINGKEVRNTINYLQLVLKHNQDIKRCVVENNG